MRPKTERFILSGSLDIVTELKKQKLFNYPVGYRKGWTRLRKLCHAKKKK